MVADSGLSYKMVISYIWETKLRREGGRGGPCIVIPSSPRPLLPPPHLEHTGYCYICHKNFKSSK